MEILSFRSLVSGFFLFAGVFWAIRAARSQQDVPWNTAARNPENSDRGRIAPKILIVSFFSLEGEVWHDNLPGSGLGDLKAQNISAPGLSPQYPAIYCTAAGDICQITTGMSEINAATTLTSVILSNKLDLRKTYFILAGIAGVNPRHGTLGSAALSQFAIQVTLQYEVDHREAPPGWSTGYFSFGTEYPSEYPGEWYGTEVFELNGALRDIAYGFASKAKLVDSEETKAYRSQYKSADAIYEASLEEPSVLKCDTTTSDVFFSGKILGDTFDNVTSLWTNGLAKYCMSAMEDNAVLETLVRFHVAGLVDFSRAILLRTGSNFDRPPPGQDVVTHLRGQHLNGVKIAVANIFIAGIEIVKGIIDDWNDVFLDGVETTNYLGDVLGTLGGTPDFIPQRASPPSADEVEKIL